MQASLMISTLLASLIILISLHAVDSSSISRRSEPQLFTLPLKRIPQPDDIHPLILLQKRIIHGTLRLAKMTGDHSLQQRVKRHILSLDVLSGIERRFNRPGVHNDGGVQLEKRFNQVGVLKPRLTGAGPSIKSAEAPTAPNSLGLDIEGHNTGYLATVQIGTPPVNFSILVDSGSADMWVGAASCNEINSKGIATGRGCGNHTNLGPNSSSFTDSGEQFIDKYGTGTVAGNIIQDTVVIANLTLRKHTFGVATEKTIDFTTNCGFDGLMGLAQSKLLSQQQTPNPIEALVLAKLVSNTIVAYKLSSVADERNDGEITFGGVDLTKFDNDTLVNLPNTDEQGFWGCKLDGISLNGLDLKMTNRTLILDTGTTLMVLPQVDADEIHLQIPGAKPNPFVDGGFTVPCNTNITVVLTIGGKQFAIDPRNLVRVNLPNPDGTKSEDCLSGISGGFGGLNGIFGTKWLVGDTLLRGVYFITDFDKNSIGLAKLIDVN